MIKRFTLLCLALLFAFSAQGFAQNEISPAKRAAIRELMALINAENKAEDVVRIMTSQLETTRDETIQKILDSRSDLTETDRKSLEEMFSGERAEATRNFQDKLMRKINFTELVGEMSAAVYDKYYTLEEIRDLINFYKTPTGQKSLRLMTPIFNETMKQMQEKLIPKIPVVIRELQEEDKAEIERKINAKKPKPDRMSS